MSAIPTGSESVSGRPVFSVVVPSFGTSPERLGRAFESLRAQSFVDWEALLVDDASPEPAEEVVRRHRALSADERIRVVRLSENRGTHVARKTGVLESRGDWILFLDADDFFAPDALAALAERLRDDPPDMVRFGVRILRRSGAEAVRLPPEAAGRPGAPCLRVLFPWNAGPFAPMCSGVYRGELCRRAFAQTTDDRLVYGEDAYELFVVSSLCKGVGRIAEPLYVYDRTGTGGITSGAGIGHAPDVRLERFLRTADERLRSFAETMRFAAEAGRSDRRVRAAALRCRRAALVGRLPLEVSRLRASGVPGRRIRAGLESALRRLSRADRVLARMGIAARRLFENAGLVRRPTGRPVPPTASAARRTEPAGRLAFADVARGIAILAVVLGHQGIPAVTRFVSPFHVPLFFLLAGFFFKESLPFPAMAAKRARSLLRPYLLASLAVLVSALLFRFARGEFGDVPVVAARRIVATLYGAAAVPRHLPFGLSLPGGGSRIPTIGPIWFLPSLFFGSVFLWLVVRLRPALRTPAVLLLFWAAWRSAGLFWLPLGIQPALCALLFMYAGWLFRGKTAASVFPSAFARAVLFAVAVAANAWFLAHYRSFHLVVCRFGRGAPDIAASLLSCWAVLEVSRALCAAGTSLTAYLRFMGRNSLLVLCIHVVEFQTWGHLWRAVAERFSSLGLPSVWTRDATIAVKIAAISLLAFAVSSAFRKKCTGSTGDRSVRNDSRKHPGGLTAGPVSEPTST